MLNLVERCKEAYPYKLGLIIGTNQEKIDNMIVNLKNQIIVVDVGIELSSYYMSQRLKFFGSTTERWMRERIENIEKPILLRNTEMLFTKSMSLDAIKIFKGYSRNRVVIASIPGKLDKQRLHVASKYDEDYKVYDLSEINIIEEI